MDNLNLRETTKTLFLSCTKNELIEEIKYIQLKNVYRTF